MEHRSKTRIEHGKNMQWLCGLGMGTGHFFSLSSPKEERAGEEPTRVLWRFCHPPSYSFVRPLYTYRYTYTEKPTAAVPAAAATDHKKLR